MTFEEHMMDRGFTRIESRILNALGDNPKGLRLSSLHPLVGAAKAGEVQLAVAALEASGYIESRKLVTGKRGRPATVLVPTMDLVDLL